MKEHHYNSLMAFTVVLTVMASTVGAALRVPPSQPVTEFDAVAFDDGVHLRWQGNLDMSVMAYRVERCDAGGAKFVTVGGAPVSCLSYVDAAWPYEVTDPAATLGQPVEYRIVAVRRDGTEAEAGVFTVTPHPPVEEVAAHEVTSPAEGESANAGVASIAGGRVKILIAESGLYGVSASELAACLGGLPPDDVSAALATGGWRLWSGTNEAAWMPAPDNTGLWFFAETVDSVYTSNTVYWLELAPGQTMATLPAVPPGESWTASSVVPETVHLERDTAGYFNNDIFADPEADVWFWGGVASGLTQATFSVSLPGVVTGLPARLTANLKGATRLPNSPEHHARCLVNGRLVGTSDWDGYEESHPSFSITNLIDGTNVIAMQGYALPGDAMSIFYVDSFDLTYVRQCRAVADRLLCAGDCNGVQRLEGFATTNVWVFDVTESCRPVRLAGPRFEAVNGGVGVSFVTGPGPRRYLAAAAPRVPVSVRGRPQPYLVSPTNRADYVALAPAVLLPTAGSLATYRQSRGLETRVVDIEDVFDEFGAGAPTPHAIREFVRAALGQWSVRPRFLALLGTGTCNYRGVSGQPGNPNFIPTLRIATPYGLCGSDTPLADIDGDHLPDLAIGRIPVVTTGDLSSVVLKIQAYEAAVTNLRSVSVMAGTINVSDGINFPASSDTLFPFIPSTYVTQTNYSSGIQKQLMRSNLTAGCTLLTYIGHANEVVLDNGTLLAASDLTWMTNAVSPPLLVMACVFGRFDKPAISTEGLAQRMVRRGTGGFSAVWGCAATTENDDNTAIGQWMTRACFRANGMTVGEAARQALMGYARDPRAKTVLMDSYTLLGDPALDMGIRNGDAGSFEEWRQAWFSTGQLLDPLVSGDDADPDEDGSSNRDEYRAGTSPLNGLSRLAVITCRGGAGQAGEVAWTTVSNRIYTLERSGDLRQPFVSWLIGVWAGGGTNAVAVPDGAGEGPWFYRVRLEE